MFSFDILQPGIMISWVLAPPSVRQAQSNLQPLNPNMVGIISFVLLRCFFKRICITGIVLFGFMTCTHVLMALNRIDWAVRFWFKKQMMQPKLYKKTLRNNAMFQWGKCTEIPGLLMNFIILNEPVKFMIV